MMVILTRIKSFLGIGSMPGAGLSSDAVKKRHNDVHDLYDRIISELGELGAYVTKGYIYDRIKSDTGFSIRHISRILNHTRREELYGFDGSTKS